MKSAKIMVSLLMVLTLTLGGCDQTPTAPPSKEQIPSSSASVSSDVPDAPTPTAAPESSSETPPEAAKTTVTANFLNGGVCEINTICISVSGEDKFGEDILNGTKIKAGEVGTVSISYPADRTMLDLKITGTKGEKFNVPGLDMSNAKDGDDANIELALAGDDMGFATHMYFPD